MNIRFLITLILAILIGTSLRAQSPDYKQSILNSLDQKSSDYGDLAMKIWDYAELGYLEEKSSKELQDVLSEAGFRIENGVAGIPTAFIATYGSGYPTIGILAEYDALPGLSQTPEPKREKREGTNNGHGCGHHLFGVASSAAAIATKEWMQTNNIAGTIRVYGCPAEEGGSGKVYLVREGYFDDVDIVLHWHPSSSNKANPQSSLANISGKFRFKGASAHAAGAPWNGRSALDGVEAMNYMVNLMREHITPESRIHYVITNGGEAPNVVPNFAEVYYYVRHPKSDDTKALFERVVKAAEGAARGTQTEMEYEIIGGVYEVLPVPSLTKIVHSNLSLVGGVQYTEEETEYAKEIQKSFFFSKVPDISMAAEVGPLEENPSVKGRGSTDVADVSWTVPTAGLRVATWIPGTPAHSWQAVACGGTSIGKKGMMVAAKTLAISAAELFSTPESIEGITEEWKQLRGKDFEYQSLLGDRNPALDYRINK